LVWQQVGGLEEGVVERPAALVNQEELEVVQVEQVVAQVEQAVQVEQPFAQLALEVCFDLEEVGGPCEKRRLLQEAGEQRVGMVQSS
jgi:hypothetical protein